LQSKSLVYIKNDSENKYKSLCMHIVGVRLACLW